MSRKAILKAFAGAGIDMGKVQWTNVFHNAQPCMSNGIITDWDQQHKEDSVNGAAWLARVAGEK